MGSVNVAGIWEACTDLAAVSSVTDDDDEVDVKNARRTSLMATLCSREELDDCELTTLATGGFVLREWPLSEGTSIGLGKCSSLYWQHTDQTERLYNSRYNNQFGAKSSSQWAAGS